MIRNWRSNSKIVCYVPFALIKIGLTTEWLNGRIFWPGYEIVKGFEDDSFFTRLNESDSEINLLMGSRNFLRRLGLQLSQRDYLYHHLHRQ